MATIELTVPDIGDVTDASVIELLVKPGDIIKPEQSLITLESDKASMEIPSPIGGKLIAFKIKLGDKLSQGAVIALLETGQEGIAPVAPQLAAQEPNAEPVATTVHTTDLPGTVADNVVAAASQEDNRSPGGALPHASPSVRRFARELGVPLAQVNGSAPKGRITHEDVQQFVKNMLTQGSQGANNTTALNTHSDMGGMTLLPWPMVDFAKYGSIERQPLSRIKKLSGANLHRNWVRIPHVTNHEDADITDLEAFRVALNEEHAKAGNKFTLLAFLIKACASALQKFPTFNASLDGDDLVFKHYIHIGFAADTPNGLVVPVVRDANLKGLLALAQETASLAAKAREGKLTPAEMSGGTFTISSLGGIGGTTFTPIINAPEVAILGVCRSAMKPVWNGQEFKPRLVLPLSLSYDHRVIDGASAAKFNAYLASLLADFRRILL